MCVCRAFLLTAYLTNAVVWLRQQHCRSHPGAHRESGADCLCMVWPRRRQEDEDDAAEAEEAAVQAASTAASRQGAAKNRRGKPRLIF